MQPDLPSHQVRDDENEFAHIEWLRQVSLITGDKGALSIFCARKRRKSQGGNPLAPRLRGAQCPNELIAVHLWHADIADEDRWPRRLQRGERVLRRRETRHLGPLIFQHRSQQIARIGLIIDGEYMYAFEPWKRQHLSRLSFRGRMNARRALVAQVDNRQGQLDGKRRTP